MDQSEESRVEDITSVEENGEEIGIESDESSNNNNNKDPFVMKEEEDEEEFQEVDSEGWMDLLGSGRIRKRIKIPGNKEKGRPQSGAEVTIKYEVSFQDNLVLEEEEVVFNLNESEVLSVLDLVVAVMNWGEICEVITDPEFAYGKLGLPEQRIPPNAAVTFNITLLDFTFFPLNVTDLEFDRKMSIGQRKKERGNFWFSREEYQLAIQCYRKSGEYFDDEQLELDVPIDRFSLPENLQEILQERLKTFNNLALCQLKVGAFDNALASLKQVLKIEPNNEKALYRKAKILQEKLKPDEALGILRRINRLYPENKLAKADILRLSAKQKKSRLQEEKMSKKMLGLDKYEEEKRNNNNNINKYISLSKSNIGMLISSSVVIVAGAVIGAAYKFRWF